MYIKKEQSKNSYYKFCLLCVVCFVFSFFWGGGGGVEGVNLIYSKSHAICLARILSTFVP